MGPIVGLYREATRTMEVQDGASKVQVVEAGQRVLCNLVSPLAATSFRNLTHSG